MGKAFLRSGSSIALQDEPYVVSRQCTDGVWVLTHEKTGRTLERTTTEIFDDYSSGKAVFGSRELRSIVGSTPRKSAPVNVPAAAMSRAKERLAFVSAIKGLPCSKAAIEPAITKSALQNSLSNLGTPSQGAKNRFFDQPTGEPTAYVSCPQAHLRAV